MLITSGIAAVVMLVGALVISGDADDDGDEEDLNTKAVLLDTAADAAAAAGVALSGAIILATGSWYWLDPAVALIIAVFVGYHAQKLLRKVATALRSPAQAERPAARPAGFSGPWDGAHESRPGGSAPPDARG